MDAAPSSELSRWIAYWTHVEPPPDPHLSTAIVAHTVAYAGWSGEGQGPRFEDYLVKIDPKQEAGEPSLEESRDRLIAALGAVRKAAPDG